jgi:TRAP-type C4-dicarboxylate transport system substrate-binding protein
LWRLDRLDEKAVLTERSKWAMKKLFFSVILCLVGVVMICGMGWAKKAPSLDKWKPAFDPSGAKYKCMVSNVSHPVIKGVFAGFAIRDELWKRTNGQIYLNYKPFSMLGGEVEVLNQLQMGAIQGMACSSVASTNLGPRFGLINLPFLVDSFVKLDKFVGSGKLFDHYMMAMDHQGIMGLDITGYGNYGWATTIPVRNIAEAKKVKFRIAEAAVNKMLYKAWGFNPVVMPWPDVPVALKQGVITGLDHTPMVCFITKKFEVAKYFTRINYAQGLFIWLFNKAWFNKLPADLQKTFREVVRDVCKKTRQETIVQEAWAIKGAKEKAGVTFIDLAEADMATLQKEGNTVYKDFAPQINKLYPGDKYRPKDFLKEVQDYLGYKP